MLKKTPKPWIHYNLFSFTLSPSLFTNKRELLLIQGLISNFLCGRIILLVTFHCIYKIRAQKLWDQKDYNKHKFWQKLYRLRLCVLYFSLYNVDEKLPNTWSSSSNLTNHCFSNIVVLGSQIWYKQYILFRIEINIIILLSSRWSYYNVCEVSFISCQVEIPWKRKKEVGYQIT